MDEGVDQFWGHSVIDLIVGEGLWGGGIFVYLHDCVHLCIYVLAVVFTLESQPLLPKKDVLFNRILLGMTLRCILFDFLPDRCHTSYLWTFPGWNRQWVWINKSDVSLVLRSFHCVSKARNVKIWEFSWTRITWCRKHMSCLKYISFLLMSCCWFGKLMTLSLVFMFIIWTGQLLWYIYMSVCWYVCRVK